MDETLRGERSSEGHTEERLDAPVQARERRMTALFRRWPALAKGEQRELRRLWDDRMRRSKQRVRRFER